MNADIHKRGVRDYSADTLQAIARDLQRKGAWEQGRLEAIKAELRTRRNKSLA